MYVPPHFRQTDISVLHDFIERHSFALVVSQTDRELYANHFPLLLDRNPGSHGELIGHMARANPQGTLADGQSVLAVFSGPHAYISPTWYEAEQVVPTWNYAAVHACGKLQVVDDLAAVLRIVRDYVEHYERHMPGPWQLPERDDFIERLARGVLGFRIPIDRLEGKWKLSQNQPRERREKTMAALHHRGDEQSRAVAALMRETLMRETLMREILMRDVQDAETKQP